RRREEQQSGHGAEDARARLRRDALAARRIGHLVVVWEERHEGGGRQAEAGRAAALLLPGVALALVEVAVLDRRDQLLRRAAVVSVVRLFAPGERDDGGMVEVVVPQRIDAVA